MKYLSGVASDTVVAGGNGNGTANTQLNIPMVVHFDSMTKSLLIANYASNNVVRCTLGDGSWTLLAGAMDASSGKTDTLLHSPQGVTLDPMGNMYVTDTRNNRVQFFLPGRTMAGVTGIAGGNKTQLSYPGTATLDSHLNLYVTDTYNHRVQKFLRY